jgi:hypothetical protein
MEVSYQENCMIRAFPGFQPIFEVFTAETIKNAIFWDAASNINRHFG